MHSFAEVIRWPQIAQAKRFPGREPAMICRHIGVHFHYRSLPRLRDHSPRLDQLQVPDLERRCRLLAGSDLLQQAVALLDDAREAAQRTCVTWFDLDQELVQEPASMLGTGLDQGQVIRPEKRD